MLNAYQSASCLLLLLCPSLLAQNKTTRIRGTVEDANTKRPIGGATVSASGDTAQQIEVTDDNGFFRLVIEGIAPGDLVRIRVAKPGYMAYDRQIVTSEEIPITVDLRRPASAATSAPATSKPETPHKPLVATDPLTARAIKMMTTEPNTFTRLNDLNIIVKSAPQDPAARDAVIAAIADADYRVREQAVADLGWINQPTREVITALQAALDDPEPRVRATSIGVLGKFSQNKEALATLIRLMGVPPHVDAIATMALFRAKIDDPRVLPALVYAATEMYDKDCAAALKQMRNSKGAMDALFTTLGTPPNINIGAMHILQSMDSDDPRVMAALVYEASVKKDEDAIKTLGQYPQNKVAVDALFTTLGTPADVNETALTTLSNMGIDDPRLSEILLSRAKTYNAPAVTLLVKKSPLSPQLIARIVEYVAASLDNAANWRSQIYINILLQAGGAPGRQALHNLLKNSDVKHQALLALAWLEVDHSAPQDILADLRLPDTQDYLHKMASTAAKGWVALPGYDSSDIECNEGPSLRAVMGLSLLDLPPHKGPVKTLIANVNAPNAACAAYAAATVAWFGPAILKAASAELIQAVTCYDGFPGQSDLGEKAAADTLALIGNDKTIAQIKAYKDLNRSYQQQNLTSCRNFGAADDVIARIQTRLNGQ